MLHPAYEDMLRFASQGQLNEEIAKARDEFIQLTGDMFESDTTYESRLANFLEWYVLDRALSFAPHLTPVKMYINEVANNLTTPEISDLRKLTRTILSIFEYKGTKSQNLRFIDLLNNEKVIVVERSEPVGLAVGNIIEARLIPYDNDTYTMSDSINYPPPSARKAILKTAKKYRKKEQLKNGRIPLVHRVAYFCNRCLRYSHLDPRQIFSEL